MNELIKISQRDGKSVVSARDLHKALEASERFSNWFERQLQFGFVDNVDFNLLKVLQVQVEGNREVEREVIDYALTLDCAKSIGMIQRSEKGTKIRNYFIECEKQLHKLVPRTHLQVLQSEMALLLEKEKIEADLLLANTKIEQDKHKVAFAETVTGSSNSILIRQFAKDLCDGEFEIGQNRLFEWFRENKYINKENEPYQEYISQGLFEVITRAIGSGTDTFTTKTTKITGKGVVYFTKKIKSK